MALSLYLSPSLLSLFFFFLELIEEWGRLTWSFTSCTTKICHSLSIEFCCNFWPAALDVVNDVQFMKSSNAV